MKDQRLRQIDAYLPRGTGAVTVTGGGPPGGGPGGGNADTLDGYHGSTTPKPLTYLTLDGNAEFAWETFKGKSTAILAIGGAAPWANGRVLQAGAGLTATDGGAGSTYTLALGTPSTLTGATTNSASGATHTHAVSTDDPDANSVNLATPSSSGTALALAKHTHSIDQSITPTWTGLHRFNVGILIPNNVTIKALSASDASTDILHLTPTNTLSLYNGRLTVSSASVVSVPTGTLVVGGTSADAKAHILSSTEQLRLGFNSTVFASHTVASNGVYTITTAGGASNNLVLQPGGDLILNPGGGDVLPNLNYSVNLGSPIRKFLTLHVAEAWFETLVAQDVVSTVGGRILVAPTSTLTRDMPIASASLYVKHNHFRPGDQCRLEARWNVEWIEISSGPTQTGPEEYLYTVARNRDGSGRNDWFAGDAVVNTGVTNSGLHDLYAFESINGVPLDGLFVLENGTTWSSDYSQSKDWFAFVPSGTAASWSVNDSVWFGHVGGQWNNLYFYVGTAGAASSLTYVWEYWNGLGWVAFTPTETANLWTSTGHKAVTWSTPLADWTAVNPGNGLEAYWVRCRITAITAPSAVPWITGRRVYRYRWQAGPTHVVWRRNSATFNDLTEHVAMGNLEGLYDYSTTTWGFAAGRYAANMPWIGVDATNGIRIMRFNTQMAQWDTLGNILIGQVAAGQSNVLITAGEFRLRVNVTDRLKLTSAGVLTVHDSAGKIRVSIDSGPNLLLHDGNEITRIVLTGTGILTIRDSAGNAVFTFDSAQGAEFTRPLTIATTGGIYQGTGTFANPTTGLKIWNQGGIGRIAGFNGGDEQWSAGTDGRLYAGGGNVRIGAEGIQLATGVLAGGINRLRWMDTWTTSIFELYAISSGGSHGGLLNVPSIPGSTSFVVVIADQVQFNGRAIATQGLQTSSLLGPSSVGELRTFFVTIEDTSAETVRMRSSAVSHPFTDVTNATTYGTLGMVNLDAGGLLLRGFTEQTAGMWFESHGVTETTTKSTSALGQFVFRAYRGDIFGPPRTGLGPNANIAVFGTGTTTRFIFDADGDAHADVSWTTFDGEDDIALLNLLTAHLTRPDDPLKKKFTEWLEQSREPLERLRIVTFNEDGHHFLNLTRLLMLLTGATRQLSERLAAAETRLHALEAPRG